MFNIRFSDSTLTQKESTGKLSLKRDILVDLYNSSKESMNYLNEGKTTILILFFVFIAQW